MSAIVQDYTATASERRAMVDNQIRTFDVTDQRVLEAFDRVPREIFVEGSQAGLAYSDAALSVRGEGATRRAMLVPMVLARMLQGLDLLPTDRALVVAGGTGYAAALLATLCHSVVSVESDPVLAEAARRNVYVLGAGNVEAVQGSLAEGHAAGAPYHVILVCGALEQEPVKLLDQLAIGGRLVAIKQEPGLATRAVGKAVRYERGSGDLSSRVLLDATAPVLDEFRQPHEFVF